MDTQLFNTQYEMKMYIRVYVYMYMLMDVCVSMLVKVYTYMHRCIYTHDFGFILNMHQKH